MVFLEIRQKDLDELLGHHMGVPENGRPNNGPQYTVILDISTSNKAPVFWERPYDSVRAELPFQAPP